MEEHPPRRTPGIDERAHGGFAASLSPHGRLRGRVPRRLVADLKEISGHRRDVVEIGAGSGILTGSLARAGCHVVVIETDAFSSTQLRLSLPSVPVVVVDGSALPIRDSSVDLVVVNWQVHTRRIVEMWSGLRRIVGDDSTVVVLRRAAEAGTVPTPDWLRDIRPDRDYGTTDEELCLTASTFTVA